MLIKAIILFAICSIVNVILNTIKSLITIKGGKTAAALANAITYGFYTYVVVLTASDDLSTLLKIGITTVTNFLGVFIVKLIEEKKTPERLWKVEMAIPVDRYGMNIYQTLRENEISFNSTKVGSYVLFNCYCQTSKETEIVKKLCLNHGGKISAYQSERV